jgi:hypothetical protein
MIRTVGELIAELEQYDPDLPVRVAVQPGHPMENAVGSVAVVDVDESHGAGDVHPVVYIGTGDQLGYLPGAVSDALDGF